MPNRLFIITLLAQNNLNAAAIDSYTNGAGISVVRKELEKVAEAIARHWAELVKICGAGGVTVPISSSALEYWATDVSV